MSALGQKQTCAAHWRCPLYPQKRTCGGALTDVRLVPIADIPEQQKQAAATHQERRPSPAPGLPENINFFCLPERASGETQELCIKSGKSPATLKPINSRSSSPGATIPYGAW